MRFLLSLLPALFCAVAACSQTPTFTANDVVPKFDRPFGYGTNMGYFPPKYYDKELAILAHGSPDGSIPGVGVTCIRPALFDHFLDYWGYDIRLDHFKLYDSIGLHDNVVFLGFPAARHRDSTFYCPTGMSEFFKNMYEPIWDNGENGTPVNENNPYATYVWKTVRMYKPYVKFWEIWNEPDFDIGGNAWKPPTMEGNWWTNTPGPCETTTHAPVFHYIRMLRISYEVIKSLDPFAYVALGGVGYTSYLDVLCRLSDNPNGGAVTTKYPKKGGAYFDCVSFHSYPHIEGAMREWSNEINGFKYFRNSDRGVDGIWEKKYGFEQVLQKHGYNGKTFPEKTWIITEINIPRKEYGEFIGSDDAQVNFIIKALVTAQMHGVDELHVYSLADDLPPNEAKTEFSFMGLFKNLKNVEPYTATINAEAIGFKTTSNLLYGKTFDSLETKRLQLPTNIRGGAFADKQGKLTYVLWAVTTRDRNEGASATYTFPNDLKVKYLQKCDWEFSRTETAVTVNAKELRLDGSPAFFTPGDVIESNYPRTPKIFPNPVADSFAVYSFWQFEDSDVTIEVFDSKGRRVQMLLTNEHRPAGAHQILLDWRGLAAGTYFVRLLTGKDSSIVPVVKI